jgi:predicted metal-binding membrane protein
MMTFGWVPMMAAMMLPGATPAIARRVREHDGVFAAPLFAGAYLAVWLLVGLAVYALYSPPGSLAAGALIVAGGLYELTPVKSAFRRRCHERLRSGARFGVACVGSSVGLMLILAGVGVMSTAWMVVIAAIVAAQKLVPPSRAIDLPLAVALVSLALVVF